VAVEKARAPGEVTRLLRAVRAGEAGALDRVVPLVYQDLRRLAQRQLAREHGTRSLRPTDLVHEAYLKLVSSRALEATDRAHFLAIAAQAMRRVLVDAARQRKAAKRGGGWRATTLSGGDWVTDVDPDELLALDDALAALDARQRQVVECRFFGGMEEQEIADALGASVRTIRRDWVKARAWLYARLYGRAETGSAGERARR
jgi:RNA polymerase sigma factor (TIGR02999 family)